MKRLRRSKWLLIFLAMLAVPALMNCLHHGTGTVDPETATEANQDAERTSGSQYAADDDPAFNQAGVCARCHVVSVLEWGISGHLEAGTDCQSCHGSSLDHVANERNEVKPDRLPHGAAIANELCSTCHKNGCPHTGLEASCQQCHHVHALIDPGRPPQGMNERLKARRHRWDQFNVRVAQGEEHIAQRQWQAAQATFIEALRLIPDHQLAQKRLAMCARRLEPHLPGFEVIGDARDLQTGLPNNVVVDDPELKLDMLLVGPGDFDMGSDRFADSRPVHTVRINAFYLSEHEVAQAQWRAMMGVNPSFHQGPDVANSDRMPVERVSWNDCIEFIARVNERVAGGGFRLPSEAEWEYACRAGATNVAQSHGATGSQLARRAWFRANAMREPRMDSPFHEIERYAPRPVGTRRPNAWSFHDMQGNVSEWCSSLWRPYVYDAADGRESAVHGGLRVLRGGNYADSTESLDPALRHAARPHRRLRFNGLRLARTVPELNEPGGTKEKSD